MKRLVGIHVVYVILSVTSVTLTNQMFISVPQSIDDNPSDSHAFLPPDVNLETKFRQPPAKGYIPAQRTMTTQRRFVT